MTQNPMFNTGEPANHPFANAPFHQDEIDPYEDEQGDPNPYTEMADAIAASPKFTNVQQWLSAPIVRETTVSITVSKKFRGDLFVESYAETVSCDGLDAGDRAALRAAVSQILQAEAEDMVNTRIEQAKANTPEPAAGLPPVASNAGFASSWQPEQAAAPQQAGPQYSGAGASAVRGVAAGGTTAGAGGQLQTVSNGRATVEFLPSSVVSSEQLVGEFKQWLASNGIDLNTVSIFDNRLPSNGKAGMDNGEFSYFVLSCRFQKGKSPLYPFILTDKGAAKNFAGVRFNHDGSYSFSFNKDYDKGVAGYKAFVEASQ